MRGLYLIMRASILIMRGFYLIMLRLFYLMSLPGLTGQSAKHSGQTGIWQRKGKVKLKGKTADETVFSDFQRQINGEGGAVVCGWRNRQVAFVPQDNMFGNCQAQTGSFDV